MSNEMELYRQYVEAHDIKQSRQREVILEIFLKTEKHLSIQELFELVRKEYPEIGVATVYRAMKIFCDAGLAVEVELGNCVVQYEHKFNHRHHDHLVCKSCGKLFEFYNPMIEKIQEEICRELNFYSNNHNLTIYGYCSECKGKEIPAKDTTVTKEPI